MFAKQLRGIAVAVALLTGIAGVPEAIASNTGMQNLGDSSSNVDVFTFTCPTDTGARAKVNDLAFPKPAGVHVLLVLGHDGSPTRQMLDNTDDGNPSVWTPIIPESGAYAVVFKKTGTAAESYNGTVQCCYDAKTCTNPVLTKRVDQ